MSVLSRVSVPAATHDLAGVAVALLSNPEGAAPRDLAGFAPGFVGDQDQLPRDEEPLTAPVGGRLATGPTGLGTSAARIPWQSTAVAGTATATAAGQSTDEKPGPELYCPPALRDDEALGEEVNDRLAEWAADDHVLDDEAMGADAKVIGSRLGITYELPSFEFARVSSASPNPDWATGTGCPVQQAPRRSSP